MKVAFVTNICAHYRVRTFELLSKELETDFYFFSEGEEWYWQQEHGINSGKFNFQYLHGISLGKTRINFGLPWKLINNPYDIYIKCVNGKFALPITYLVARLRRKPFILWTGIWMRLQTFTHRLIYPFTKYVYLHSDAIVVYGNHVKQFLINEGVSSDRIFVASHAIDNRTYSDEVSDFEKDALLEKLEIDKHRKVILYLGRLDKSKGIKFLLSAFSKLPDNDDYLLIIAGSGPEEQGLKQRSRELGISDQIRFPGYIEKDYAKNYYSISTFLVLPSITLPTGKEPWGLVVNEAFNQGLPVIVSDAVGAAGGGLVENGINGIIVKEGDIDGLVTAMMGILSDDELRAFLSKNARSSISVWDNVKMVKGFVDAVDFAHTQK